MELLNVMKNLTLKPSDNNQQKIFKSVSAEILNVPTEIVLAEYADKTMLIISQFEKVGSLLMVHKEEAKDPLSSNDINAVYTTKVIFGAAGDGQHVTARYLAEVMKITKPLCLFINLKSYDSQTISAIKQIILNWKSEETS